MNSSLTLPSPIHHTIIERADLAPSTKAKYKSEIDKLIQARINPLDRDALLAYASGLPHSRRAHLKAVIALLYEEDVTRLEAAATPGNLAEMQARLLNIKAMTKTIKVRKQKGHKSHLWLTDEQVEMLTSLPNRSTVQGRRDWIVLALLLSGLRCEEVATITFDRLVRRPMSNGQMRAALNVTGKGAKDRTVPLDKAGKIEKYLLEWRSEAGDGFITRSINKAGAINGSLSDRSIYTIVQKYGRLIGLPQLDPHDLRRTYAQIGYRNTHDLVLVSTLLGHESLETTKVYLDLEINLNETISDYIPLSGD